MSSEEATPPTGERDASRDARNLFHWALAGILLPVISLPFVLGLAAFAVFVCPRKRGWTPGVVVLALVDTAIAIIVLAAPDTFSEPTPNGLRYMVGIRADPDVSDAVVVDQVLEGFPAEAAGVLSADLVLAVDGQPVRSIGELGEIVERVRDERPVRLTIERDAEELVVDVTAVASLPAPPEPRGLFEPWAEGFDGWFDGLLRRFAHIAWFAVPLLLLLGLAWAHAPSAEGVGWVAATAGVMLFADSLGALTVVAATGGSSAGSTLVGQAFSCIVTIALGLFALRRVAAWTGGTAHATFLRTVVVGAFYGVTVTLRVSALLAFVLVDAGLADTVSDPWGDFISTAPLSAPAMAGFAAVVVVLGPVTEEIVFRGLILGWLRGWLGDVGGVLLSAALFALVHPHYGPAMVVIFVHGVVFAWARIRSGGLWAPMALHILVNGLVWLLSS